MLKLIALAICGLSIYCCPGNALVVGVGSAVGVRAAIVGVGKMLRVACGVPVRADNVSCMGKPRARM